MRTTALIAVVALAAVGCRGSETVPPPATAQPAQPPGGDQAASTPEPGSNLQPATPAARGEQAPAPAPASPAQVAGPTTPLAAEAPAVAPEPPAPRYREVTIPEGTELALTLETAVASDSSRVEDAVRASVRRAVVVGDARVVPSGTVLHGSVVDVARSGKVKGRARVSLRFTDLVLDDERIAVHTSAVTREAQSTKKKDAAKVGVPAAGGAIIGAIAGGGKGAAIGAAVGGGAGTAVVMSTRGEEVRLAAGTPVTVHLTAPITVRIRE